MPLYEIRYATVRNLLQQANIQTVLDIGCGNGRFIQYLLQYSSFTQLAGMDNSLPQFRRAWRRVENDSRAQLFLRSFLDFDESFCNYDAVVAMEVIEHLSAMDLFRLVNNIFLLIAPPLVIITTPNRSYNVNYPILWNGLRHSSHKFEFNENELVCFGEKIVAVASEYTFSCGFCDPEHASQFIIFRKK